MKKLLILLLVTVFLISGAGGALAHSSSQEGQVEGRESIGWRIDESAHTNKTSTNSVQVSYYVNRINEFWRDEVDDLIRIGRTGWGAKFVFTETSSSSCPNKIEVANVGDGHIIAHVTNIRVDSNRHYTGWTMELNKMYLDGTSKPKMTSKTIVHEFGHVLGVAHVSDSSNRNKIMYPDPTECTVLTAQERDRLGAEVITGIHNHSGWSYSYYDRPSPSQTRHKRTCTSCYGYKYWNCVYLSNVCKYCGASKYPVAK